MSRLLLLLALLWPIPANAYPCWVIRKAVAEYGETAVEAWAKSKGYSPKEISRIRKQCGI